MAGRDKARKSSSKQTGASKAALPPELAASLARLPRKPQKWLGTQIVLPIEFEDLEGPVMAALWMDAESNVIRSSAIAGGDTPDLLVKALMQAMCEPAAGASPCIPQSVAVENPQHLPQLQGLLQAAQITAATHEDFSAAHRFVEGFLGHLQGGVPNPLGSGLPQEELGLYCQRMGALWAAAPWRVWDDSDMVRVEGLTPAPLFISIVGAMNESFGFAAFLSEEAAARLLHDDDAEMENQPCLISTFADEEEVDQEWMGEVKAHGWPTPEEGFFPTAMRLGEEVRDPNDDEMRLTSLLAALLVELPLAGGEPGHQSFHIDGRTGTATWPVQPRRPARKARRTASSPAQESADPDTLFQLKISLRGATPPIWRRVLVRGSSSLKDLHQVIQATMGWDDDHLWAFTIRGRKFGPDEHSPERAHLADLGLAEKSRFRYLYDFGDCWEHSILVEEILKAEPDAVYPQCCAGRRAAPVEDCGGIDGYMDLLEALDDPDCEDYDDAADILGEDFDPKHVDLEEINRLLGELSRPRRRPRAK